jgi:2-(1,2-epoxy-1,2-dihydrophenyl)acetyl-CoA isomerase
VTSEVSGKAPGAGDPAGQLAFDLYQALAHWDTGRLAELLHSEFEGTVTAGMPLNLGGSYHGPAAMISDFWARIGRSFAGVRAVPADLMPLPDGRLMVTGRYEGTARASGGELSADFVHLLTFSGGRIIGITQLTDSARWASALAGPNPAGALVPAQAAALSEPGIAVRPPVSPAPSGPRTGRLVSLEVADGLATLTLNRPAARNALDAGLIDDLQEAAQRCAADPAIRAVLICAAGPAFTVGGDIALFGRTAPAELPGQLRRWTTSYHATLRVLDGLRVPVVAGVHGAVAGGGLGLMHVADVVLAAEGTKFATGFAGLGLSGDGGSTWFLPRLIGARRAAEMYFGERVLDAEQAADWGLISRVVPAEVLQAEAEQTARRLAAGPTRAFGELRALLRGSADATLGDQLLAETEALARSAASRDAAHAIESFLAKAKPEFRGW